MSRNNGNFTTLISRWFSAQRRWIWDLFPNLRDAAFRWSEDDAGSMAASVAYYLALSLFPMLLLLTTGLGLFLEFTELGKDAQTKLLDTISQHGSEVIKEQVSQVLQQFKEQSVVSGPIGTLMAILAAIAVFAQLDKGFDKVWRVPAKKGLSLQRTILNVLLHRCFAFLMLLCLGGAVVALFVAQMVLAQVKSIAFARLDDWFSVDPSELDLAYKAIQLVFVIGANALLFGALYKYLPKKEVGWNEALRGGLLTSIIWELGRTVLGVFLIGMKYTVAYGVIGSFIALLLWCYYGMSIIFFGAEYVQVLQQRRQATKNTSPLTPIDEEVASAEPLVGSIDSNALSSSTVDGDSEFVTAPTSTRIRPRLRGRS